MKSEKNDRRWIILSALLAPGAPPAVTPVPARVHRLTRDMSARRTSMTRADAAPRDGAARFTGPPPRRPISCASIARQPDRRREQRRNRSAERRHSPPRGKPRRAPGDPDEAARLWRCGPIAADVVIPNKGSRHLCSGGYAAGCVGGAPSRTWTTSRTTQLMFAIAVDVREARCGRRVTFGRP